MMKAFQLTVLTAFLLLTSSCAIYHHYDPYYGIVIDAETEKPIEGAVVLVYYKTWMYGSPGGPSVDFLDAQETITDQKGEFKIPSLNAFAFRPLSTFDSEPGFRIFKTGYSCSSTRLFEDQYDWARLRKLKTKEERREFNLSSCTPILVPFGKRPQFNKLQSVERVELGLKP